MIYIVVAVYTLAAVLTAIGLTIWGIIDAIIYTRRRTGKQTR